MKISVTKVASLFVSGVLITVATEAPGQMFETTDEPVIITGPNTPACQTVTVPTSLRFLGLTVEATIDHWWAGDITIEVSEPGGSYLTLMNRPGRTASGPGSPTQLNVSTPLLFGDSAPSGISAEQLGLACSGGIIDGTTGCEDNYYPFPDAAETPIAGQGSTLGDFNDIPAQGDWQICAADCEFTYTGTLSSAKLGVPGTIPYRAFVISTDRGTLTAVNTWDLEIDHTVSLNRPLAQTLTPDGTVLYVAGETGPEVLRSLSGMRQPCDGYISFVDVDTIQVINTICLPMAPNALTVQPETGIIFAAGRGPVYGGTLMKIDPSTPAILWTVPLELDACHDDPSIYWYPIDIEAPAGSARVFVSSVLSVPTGNLELQSGGPILIYEANSLAQESCITGSFEKMLTPADGEVIYAIEHMGEILDRIAVINPTTAVVIDSLPNAATGFGLRWTSDIALASGGTRLAVAGGFEPTGLPGIFNEVQIFDTSSGMVINRIGALFDLGILPDRIAMDPWSVQVVAARATSDALDRYVLSEIGGATSRWHSSPAGVLVVPGRLDLLFKDDFESGNLTRWSSWAP